jgi:CubicO group peptidase (beta-lactamase class C family)
VELEAALDEVAERHTFSGAVRIDRGQDLVVERAYGLAHRGWGIVNQTETRFAIASGTKGVTALAVVALIEDGALSLETTARSLLGSDLPLVPDRVTVEHLLSHRSGIGDYVDEDAGVDVDDYLMPVPVHELVTSDDYLVVLEGHPPKFEPGARFSYCNSGYVVLALLAERASGIAFHELVVSRVCEPAGMRDTVFLRSDELPGRTAAGYIGVNDRTNIFHLPVRGSGDGGIYTTVADVRALWTSFFAGRIVPLEWVAEMLRARSDVASQGKRYGLGFWLDAERPVARLEGMDAGVSFLSWHDPERDMTATIVSNTTDGAWPLARWLRERLGRTA